MVEHLEYSGFIFSNRPLLSRHILHVERLYDPKFLGESRLDEVGRARGVLIQLLFLPVLVLLFLIRFCGWLITLRCCIALCVYHADLPVFIFTILSLFFKF